jgi:hypothetical protein
MPFFISYGGTTPPGTNDGLLIPPITTEDVIGTDPHQKPKEKTIFAIIFQGTECTLKLQAIGRKKVGGTKWVTDKLLEMQHNHDNMPPGGTTEK